MHVVAAQFLCNGPAGPRELQDNVLLAKRRQQVRQVGPQVTMRAQRRRVAVAARQVRVQELLDEGLIDLIGRQPTPRHPVGEVGQARRPLSILPSAYRPRPSSAWNASTCGDSGPSSSQALASG